MPQKRAAIILAAGKGKRMKSDLPKVLHQLHGKAIIGYLMKTFANLKLDKVVVVIGYKGKMVIDELSDFEVEFAWQREQLGTGHAAAVAEEILSDFEGSILIAAGDVPFLSAETMMRLFETHTRNNASATCLSAVFDDPKGYGRIIRQPGTDILLEIIEDKDADSETKRITEINTGTFCFNSRDLFSALRGVGNDNAQREYYLTDTIKILRNSGKICAVMKTDNPVEVRGINSLAQLKALERETKN
jgi:bifunctional UDP-N-acetylglucosamine pyrophosphorylase/glucosamine-1-phosphate N-acetyltransferase